MWWVVTIVCLVLLGAAGYIYLAVTCFFTEVTFLTAFNVNFQHSGSREQAFRAAMKVFHGRRPFNVLTEADLDRLVGVFSVVPDPRSVARMWRAVDRKQDASNFTNEDFLNRLHAEFRRIEAANRAATGSDMS